MKTWRNYQNMQLIWPTHEYFTRAKSRQDLDTFLSIEKWFCEFQVCSLLHFMEIMTQRLPFIRLIPISSPHWQRAMKYLYIHRRLSFPLIKKIMKIINLPSFASNAKMTAKGHITAFSRTLKSSFIALNHLPRQIFTVILRTSFRNSTTKSLIHLKVEHMLKINFTHKVLLLNRNVCLRI